MNARLMFGLCVAVSLGIAFLGCGKSAPTEVAGKSVYQAADEGDLLTVTTMIRGGLKVNAPDDKGMTVVHHAVIGGHADLLEALMEEFRADVNVKDAQGKTPLAYAKEKGNPQILQMLQDGGAQE